MFLSFCVGNVEDIRVIMDDLQDNPKGKND